MLQKTFSIRKHLNGDLKTLISLEGSLMFKGNDYKSRLLKRALLFVLSIGL
jgi:hypothetical protein